MNKFNFAEDNRSRTPNQQESQVSKCPQFQHKTVVYNKIENIVFSDLWCIWTSNYMMYFQDKAVIAMSKGTNRIYTV